MTPALALSAKAAVQSILSAQDCGARSSGGTSAEVDDDTFEYAVSALQSALDDNNISESSDSAYDLKQLDDALDDVEQLLAELLVSAFDGDDVKCEQACRKAIQQLKNTARAQQDTSSGPTSSNNNNSNNSNNSNGKNGGNGSAAPPRTAGVLLAKVAAEQERDLQARILQQLGGKKTVINVNEDMNGVAQTIIDWSVDEGELRRLLRGQKRVVKQEKRQVGREKKYALERDEIIRSITNKPVKVHNFDGAVSEDGGRLRDIILENIDMGLGALELLTDTDVIIADGRKYGLVGRNGIGKTTFLKHLASRQFPNIPGHLQIVHIEQEVPATSTTVLQTVLNTDIERKMLLEEAAAIQKKLDSPKGETAAPTEAKRAAAEPASSLADGGARASGDAEPTAAVISAQQEASVDAEEELDEFELDNLTEAQLGARLAEVFQRLVDIDSDSADAHAASILSGLGFTPDTMNWPTSAFSGGWRMRVSIAMALFIEPDVLLLDEPTNHLDLHSVMWLEDYLNNEWAHRTVVIVSHDRDFLNTVCTDILHLQSKTIVRYKGDYDVFERTRADLAKERERQAETQQKQASKLQTYVDKHSAAAATAKQAQSRMKKLAKLQESMVTTMANDPSVRLAIPDPDPLPGHLIECIDVGFGYPPKRPEDAPPLSAAEEAAATKLLFSGVHLGIDMTSRAALVGSNGVGKSTLMKVLLGDLEPVQGMIRRNPKARIARFTQHHMDMLDPSQTSVSTLQKLDESANIQDIRKHLGTVGITGNLALQPISSLSGGQKSRVSFAVITYLKPHLLLLDEPTNHLDMDTIDALIRALAAFEGGILVISHDSHLLGCVCEEIWVCADQTVKRYPGDFEEYRKELARQHNAKLSIQQ